MNLINARIMEHIKLIKHYLYTKKQVRNDKRTVKLSPSLWTPTNNDRMKKIKLNASVPTRRKANVEV
jgi:hypothetical protein